MPWGERVPKRMKRHRETHPHMPRVVRTDAEDESFAHDVYASLDFSTVLSLFSSSFYRNLLPRDIHAIDTHIRTLYIYI